MCDSGKSRIWVSPLMRAVSGSPRRLAWGSAVHGHECAVLGLSPGSGHRLGRYHCGVCLETTFGCSGGRKA
jgi:hypothetical protein